MAVDRVKCYASVSAFLHVGLGVIGTIVFIVLLVVVGAREKEPPKAYEDSHVIVMCYLAALLIYFILMFAFSIALIMGLGKRRHPLMAPFVYLVYGGTWIYVLLSFRHFISGLWNVGPFIKLFVNLIINLVAATIQTLIFWPVYMLYKRWRANPPGPREQNGLEEAQPVNSANTDGIEI